MANCSRCKLLACFTMVHQVPKSNVLSHRLWRTTWIGISVKSKLLDQLTCLTMPKIIRTRLSSWFDPPGNGKSLCYLIVAGCIVREVTLVIQPTLTLSADQAFKLNLLPQDLRVTVYNIDMCKSPQDMDSIVHKLRSLKDVSPDSLSALCYRFAEV